MYATASETRSLIDFQLVAAVPEGSLGYNSSIYEQAHYGWIRPVGEEIARIKNTC